MLYLRTILLLLMVALQSHADQFKIYAFIPWKTNDAQSKLIESRLESYGIIPIKVIYEHHITTHGKIDGEKLKRLANMSRPDIPISFDLESGNRFHPETVLPKVQEVLQTYKTLAPQSVVGVYAILPQITYSWNKKIANYDQLNEKYKSLINFVDFLSPVLYNYDGSDLQAWHESARFNIQAAKRYALGKPIIPYISPIIRLHKLDAVKDGNLVEELDENSMAARLQILYDLGASGCIIWASSQDRTKDGHFPVFDPDKAWGRAVVTFIKTHKVIEDNAGNV